MKSTELKDYNNERGITEQDISSHNMGTKK